MTVKEIKFTRGVPPACAFPADRLADCACAVLKDNAAVVLQYGGPGGFPPLRQAIAAEAGVEESRVAVGQGSLQLLDILARNLVKPGTAVFVENPTYDRTLSVMRHAEARVVGVPLQPDGMDIDFVEDQLKEGVRPRLLYTIPDFQNPSGVVLALAKRQRLVELAERYDFWLAEDIPYRKLRYHGESLPTFLSLAPERTIQLSSYSKLIGPGVRVGSAVMPTGLAPAILKFIDDTYICPSYLTQAMVYEFIARGWLDENITSLRKLYAPRLQAMLEALERELGSLATWFKPQGGFFVGVNLMGRVTGDALLACAREAGLVLTDGRGFYSDRRGDAFVRLPFSALTPEEICEGVARLAGVVRQVMA